MLKLADESERGNP